MTTPALDLPLTDENPTRRLNAPTAWIAGALAFALAGLGPALGALIMGYIFVKSVIDLNNPENSYSGSSLLGVQPPLAIAILGLLLGVILMGLQWWSNPAFFRRKSESADPEMRL